MDKRRKILGIIPARAGSKGIPHKNIRLLADRPLIDYTIQSALLSNELDTILVSSDCEETITISRKYARVEAPFIRPKELSLDNTPTIAVIQHAVEYYAEIGQTFDYVCLLQPTSPFREDNLIDKAIQHIVETGADSLTTIRKIPTKYNPHWAFKMGENENLLSISTGDKYLISRRQELPDAWYRDGKVYIATIEQIQKGTLSGGKFVGFINENEPDVNIDTWEDWELAEKFLGYEFPY